MNIKNYCLFVIVAFISVCIVTPIVYAANDTDKENFEALRADIEIMRASHNHQLNLLKQYEEKVRALENKIETLEYQQHTTTHRVQSTQEQVKTTQEEVKETREEIEQIDRRENKYNPQVGVVLQGRYNHYSEDNEIRPAGFTLDSDGSRDEEDFSLDGTELMFSGNVDEHFKANVSVVINDDDGTTDVSVQEAFITSDIIHQDTEIKVGRFFPRIGALNEQHTHADDFVDRPLANRVFLNNAYRDDGVQIAAKIPWVVKAEIGAGAFKGDGVQSNIVNADIDAGAWTAYGRLSDEEGDTRWSVGASTLQTNLSNDNLSTTAGFIESNDSLYVLDAKLAFAPTGDQTKQDVVFEGEYFYRRERDEFKAPGGSSVPLNKFNEEQHGFYVQGLYKFHPQLRVGGRFSQLYSGDVVDILPNGQIEEHGYSPWSASAMMDWTSSKQAIVRAQYNHEEFDNNQKDNQILLQYIMSIGTDVQHGPDKN